MSTLHSSADGRELLDLIDRLRSIDNIEKDIPLPQIVVCGQSHTGTHALRSIIMANRWQDSNRVVRARAYTQSLAYDFLLRTACAHSFQRKLFLGVREISARKHGFEAASIHPTTAYEG